MIKAEIPSQFLIDWFLKSLQPENCKDVTMMGEWSKEEAILKAQHLDLIYSQSGLLYQIMPNVPRAKMDLTKVILGPPIDGVINSMVSQVTSSMGKVSLR